MARRHGLIVAAVVLLTAIAGCGDGPGPAEPDVIVLSGNVVDANTTQAAPTGKGVGHIAGFVVDDAIRPVKGATVSLPALDLQDITDRDGRFEFVDLAPGDHVIRINASGHQEAESILEVKKGAFTRAKVILHRIPPPEPFREVWKAEGFADVTQSGLVVVSISGTPLLCECHWYTGLEGGPNTTTVIEVGDGGYTGGAPGSTGYWVQAWGAGGVNEIMDAPFWLLVPGHDLDPADLEIQVTPYGSPLPEVNKAFEVFVTVFHNENVPAGYSIVAGNA